MATTAILDLRQTDERVPVLKSPTWIRSAEITPACDDKAALMFSFPLTKADIVVVHNVMIEVTQAFAGGTIVLNIGSYTLATDAVTTAGDATIVDIDDWIPTASITSGTLGWYAPAAGDWLTAKAAGTLVFPYIVVCAATTVYTMAATLTSDAAITAGKARVYAEVSYLP